MWLILVGACTMGGEIVRCNCALLPTCAASFCGKIHLNLENEWLHARFLTIFSYLYSCSRKYNLLMPISMHFFVLYEQLRMWIYEQKQHKHNILSQETAVMAYTSGINHSSYLQWDTIDYCKDNALKPYSLCTCDISAFVKRWQWIWWLCVRCGGGPPKQNLALRPQKA